MLCGLRPGAVPTTPVTFTIGQLAGRAGVTPRAIRYYEKLGLLRPPRRTPSNYRIFESWDVERLAFISNCRALGFAIPEIARLLRIMDDPDHTCAQVAELGRRHLRQVDAKLEELVDARNRIAQVLAHCSGAEAPECAMLDDLTRAPSPGVDFASAQGS